MQTTVYLICGVSGAGKSWVCRQLKHAFHYLPHDKCWKHPTKKPKEGNDPRWEEGAESTHIEEILKAVKIATNPILTECPFGERLVREQLEKEGLTVIPYFVIEPPHVVQRRYFQRESKPLPKAAHTRASTIKDRAEEWKAPSGNSLEILQLLQALS